MTERRLKFVIETRPASRTAWWLLDDDDRVVAWAGRTFTSLAHADQAAHDFRVGAGPPVYRVEAGARGRWTWSAWEPQGERVARSADWFPSEQAAVRAARRVRQQVRAAIGP